MTIETKFDVGEKAVIIHNDDILTLPVERIQYNHGNIIYHFLLKKAPTLLDKDLWIDVQESQCFKSIDELADHYKNKLKS